MKSVAWRSVAYY